MYRGSIDSTWFLDGMLMVEQIWIRNAVDCFDADCILWISRIAPYEDTRRVSPQH